MSKNLYQLSEDLEELMLKANFPVMLCRIAGILDVCIVISRVDSGTAHMLKRNMEYVVNNAISEESSILSDLETFQADLLEALENELVR